MIFSRIRYLVAPSKFSSHPPSRVSVRLSPRTMKIAKAYYGESGKDNMKPGNLSSTLDKLYAWEKKLYKEVKVRVPKQNSISSVFYFFNIGLLGLYVHVCIKTLSFIVKIARFGLHIV